MTRRCLVTGGAGFVGANLVRRLLADGHRVVATARPDGEAPWRLEGVADAVEIAEADLRDAEAVGRLVAAARPDWVFHLAAHGAYSWQRDLERMVAVNVTATGHLLEAARDAGAEAFVHAGSSSEYGFKDHAPAEDEAVEPNSHYAVTKVAATHLCRHAAIAHDAHVVTLRLYSVYGPWEEPRRLVPQLVARGLEGALPPLVSPDTARDFVYADDVSDALVRAAGRTDLPRGSVLNVGSGAQTSLRDLVAAARRVLPIREEPRWGSTEQRSWDTTTWVANPARARAALGWTARHGLEDGLRATAEWMRSEGAPAHRYGKGAVGVG